MGNQESTDKSACDTTSAKVESMTEQASADKNPSKSDVKTGGNHEDADSPVVLDVQAGTNAAKKAAKQELLSEEAPPPNWESSQVGEEKSNDHNRSSEVTKQAFASESQYELEQARNADLTAHHGGNGLRMPSAQETTHDGHCFSGNGNDKVGVRKVRQIMEPRSNVNQGEAIKGSKETGKGGAHHMETNVDLGDKDKVCHSEDDKVRHSEDGSIEEANEQSDHKGLSVKSQGKKIERSQPHEGSPESSSTQKQALGRGQSSRSKPAPPRPVTSSTSTYKGQGENGFVQEEMDRKQLPRRRSEHTGDERCPSNEPYRMPQHPPEVASQQDAYYVQHQEGQLVANGYHPFPPHMAQNYPGQNPSGHYYQLPGYPIRAGQHEYNFANMHRDVPGPQPFYPYNQPQGWRGHDRQVPRNMAWSTLDCSSTQYHLQDMSFGADGRMEDGLHNHPWAEQFEGPGMRLAEMALEQPGYVQPTSNREDRKSLHVHWSTSDSSQGDVPLSEERKPSLNHSYESEVGEVGRTPANTNQNISVSSANVHQTNGSMSVSEQTSGGDQMAISEKSGEKKTAPNISSNTTSLEKSLPLTQQEEAVLPFDSGKSSSFTEPNDCLSHLDTKAGSSGENVSEAIQRNSLDLTEADKKDSTIVSPTSAQSMSAQSTSAQSTSAQSTSAQSTSAQSTSAQSTAAQSTSAQSTSAQSTSAQSTSAQSTSAQSTPAQNESPSAQPAVSSKTALQPRPLILRGRGRGAKLQKMLVSSSPGGLSSSAAKVDPNLKTKQEPNVPATRTDVQQSHDQNQVATDGDVHEEDNDNRYGRSGSEKQEAIQNEPTLSTEKFLEEDVNLSKDHTNDWTSNTVKMKSHGSDAYKLAGHTDWEEMHHSVPTLLSDDWGVDEQDIDDDGWGTGLEAVGEDGQSIGKQPIGTFEGPNDNCWQTGNDWTSQSFDGDKQLSNVQEQSERGSLDSASMLGNTSTTWARTENSAASDCKSDPVETRTPDLSVSEASSSTDWGQGSWATSQAENKMVEATTGVPSTKTTSNTERRAPPKFGSNTARRLATDSANVTVPSKDNQKETPSRSHLIDNEEDDLKPVGEVEDLPQSQGVSTFPAKEKKDHGAVIRVNNLPETNSEHTNTKSRDFLIRCFAKYIRHIRSIFVLVGHAFVNFTSSSIAKDAYEDLSDSGLSHNGMHLLFTLYTDTVRVQRSISAEARRPQGRIMPHEVAAVAPREEEQTVEKKVDRPARETEVTKEREPAVEEDVELEAVIRVTGFKAAAHLHTKMFLAKAFSKYAHSIAGIFVFTMTNSAFLNFTNKEQAARASSELAGKLSYKGSKLKMVVNTDAASLQRAKASQEKYKDHYLFSSLPPQGRPERDKDQSWQEDMPYSEPPKAEAATQASTPSDDKCADRTVSRPLAEKTEKHTVWVGNVSNLKGSEKHREGILLNLFRDYVQHIGSIAVFDRFAFVNFTERSAAESAVTNVRKSCPVYSGQQLIFRLDKANAPDTRKKGPEDDPEGKKRTVFLKDLPKSASNKHVRAAFGRLAYNIAGLDVHKDPRSGQMKCYGFVRFRSVKAMNEVMAELDNTLVIEDESVTMRPVEQETETKLESSKAVPKPNSGKGSPSTRRSDFTLVMKNLPLGMTEDEIISNLFWHSEGVQSVRLPQNPSGRLGMAYIDCTSEKEAKSILNRLDGEKFRGRMLAVETYHPSVNTGGGTVNTKASAETIGALSEGGISNQNRSSSSDAVAEKADQNQSVSHMKSSPKRPSPTDDRVRIEQYMSRETFEFVKRCWSKELKEAKLSDDVEVTWSEGTAVILGHSNRAVNRLAEQVLDLVSEDDIEISPAEIARWTKTAGDTGSHLSVILKEREDKTVGFHIDTERGRLLVFGNEDAVDHHLEQLQQMLKKCYPLTSHQVKLLDQQHPSLRHNVSKEHGVAISTLEANPNTLSFSNANGGHKTAIQSAMRCFDDILQDYRESSHELDSALLVPAMKFVRSHGEDVLVTVDGDDWSGENDLTVDMDMDKSFKQKVTICCCRGDVVKNIHSKLVGGPVTQQLSLRVDLLRVVLGSGDLQLLTIAEANSVAYRLWMPDASSTSPQGTLQFLSWLPEDAQAAVATVNIAIMAENKIASRQLTVSPLKQQYLVDVLYHQGDTEALAAFEAAVKDVGRLEANFDESKEEINVKGPKYKMTLLERQILEDPLLLGGVDEKQILVNAPAVMHSLTKEKFLDAAVKGRPIVTKMKTLDKLVQTAATVRSLSGQISHVEVAHATSDQSESLSVSLCGKHEEVEQALTKIKKSLSILRQFIVIPLTEEELHIILHGSAANFFHEITSLHCVHVVFVGFEPGGGPLAILGGEDEKLSSAHSALQACLHQCLKPPDPPKPYAVLTQLQERYLVCRREGWVSDFEQRHCVAIAYGQPTEEDYQQGKTELWEITDISGGMSSGENVNIASRELHKVIDSLCSANLEINFPAKLTQIVESSLSYSLQYIEMKYNVACLFTRLSSCDELTLAGVTSTICTAAVNVCSDNMASVSAAMTVLQGTAQDQQSFMLQIPRPAWQAVMAEQAKIEAVHGAVLLPCWWNTKTDAHKLPLLLLASTKEAVVLAQSELMQILARVPTSTDFPVLGNHGNLHTLDNLEFGQEVDIGLLGTGQELSAHIPGPAMPAGVLEMTDKGERKGMKDDKEEERDSRLKTDKMTARQTTHSHEGTSPHPEESKALCAEKQDIERQVCVPGPLQPALLQALTDIFSVSVTTFTRDEGYSDPMISPSVDVTLCGSTDDVKEAVRYLKEQLCEE